MVVKKILVLLELVTYWPLISSVIESVFQFQEI